jgi:chromosome segregation ATPase
MDLLTAAALVAALGGTAGIAALVKAIIDGRTSARQHDLDVVRTVVDHVQEENTRLGKQLAAYEALSEKERGDRLALQVEFQDVKRQNMLLRRSLEQVEQILDQVRAENVKLRNEIDDLKRRGLVLRRELEEAQKHIAELVVENKELRRQVNEERS